MSWHAVPFHDTGRPEVTVSCSILLRIRWAFWVRRVDAILELGYALPRITLVLRAEALRRLLMNSQMISLAVWLVIFPAKILNRVFTSLLFVIVAE